MNTDALRKSLILHEGYENLRYTCPAGKLTIGVGHNLDRPISDAAVNQILSDDVAECIAELDRAFDGWRDHSAIRQNVLVEMVFNLGAGKLAGFRKMWAALRRRDFEVAAQEMLLSDWAIQVGKRAVTLSDLMRKGRL